MTTTLDTPNQAPLKPPTARNDSTPIRAPGIYVGEHPLGLAIRNALVITRREVRDSFRDWRIMGPIFVLTLIFPTMAQGATQLVTNFFEQNGAAPLLNNFLPLLPMIIGFFPVSISLVIALETFVGEKERRSLEPLLSTPLTNTELYVGKTLAAMLPPLLASYLGISIYVAGLVFGPQQWRPPMELLFQLLLLTTVQALVMVTGAVVVSSQTTSTRAANLLASFIIIPISLLVMFESFVMITNNRYVLWYIIGGLMVADVILFTTGARIFNREELLGRQMDEINLRWAGRVFWRALRGKAGSVGAWYRQEVFSVIPRLRIPMVVVLICLVGVFIGGYAVARVRPDYQFPNTPTQYQDTFDNINSWTEFGAIQGSAGSIVTQNMRLFIFGTLTAVFSFGVFGVIAAVAPFGVLGFLIGQPILADSGFRLFIGGVLPHKLIALPAILLAGAVTLRLGAVIVHPPPDKTVGEAWLGALGDTLKILFAVVMPLLIVSALVEVYITPLILKLVMGQ
jgi:uncharacterized membrane protein SpoIIM required for sporulation/ABC-type transport system involved in multi-copper enzyme maturation permease subunit